MTSESQALSGTKQRVPVPVPQTRAAGPSFPAEARHCFCSAGCSVSAPQSPHPAPLTALSICGRVAYRDHVHGRWAVCFLGGSPTFLGCWKRRRGGGWPVGVGGFTVHEEQGDLRATGGELARDSFRGRQRTTIRGAGVGRRDGEGALRQLRGRGDAAQPCGGRGKPG